VHPEQQSRPAHGWFHKTQKIALKATSARKRLNIQGALDELCPKVGDGVIRRLG